MCVACHCTYSLFLHDRIGLRRVVSEFMTTSATTKTETETQQIQEAGAGADGKTALLFGRA